MAYKLGKTPARRDPNVLLFTQFEEPGATLTIAPIGFGHEKLVSDWGMLGNDTVGDCVEAGAAHETEMWNEIAKIDVPFTPACVLSDYSAATGYNPAEPNTDQGTDVQSYLGYRRKTGVLDASGARHKIGGYVALECPNWWQLLEALYIFDAVGIGFNFPNTAMTQFDAGQPWALVPGSTIEGGHYVPVLGRPHISMLEVVTWGTTQLMTRAFYQTYCDEAYGILSVESMINGKTAEGYNLVALEAAITAL